MNMPKLRKIIDNIPDGLYCYEIIGTRYNKKWKARLPRSLPCPYYKHKIGVEGKCKLYHCEVEDMCKSCRIKIDRR